MIARYRRPQRTAHTLLACGLCACLVLCHAHFAHAQTDAPTSANDANATPETSDEDNLSTDSENVESIPEDAHMSIDESQDDLWTLDEDDDPWSLDDEEDPFAALEDDDFEFDEDEYTLDTVYFVKPPAGFQRFDLDKTRGTEAVDTEQMREHGARNVEEAITAMTPWTPLPSTSASPGPLIVDGLDGSWTQVLIDGIPYTRTQTGRNGPYPDLGNIPVDPGQIDRIEIYRGGGPNGTCGATGVVMNMITKDPTQRVSGNISLDAGITPNGFSRYGGRGDLTIPIGEEWALRANGGWTRHLALDVDNDGKDDRPQRTVDDVQIQSLWRPDGEDRLTVGLRTFGTRQWVSPDDPETDLGDRTDQRGYAGNLRYKTPDDNENQLTARFSIQHTDHRFYKHVPWTGNTLTKARTKALALNSNLTWAREYGDHEVSAELCHTLDFVQRSGESGEMPDVREQQVCIGANDIWKISDLVTLEANLLGGYHDATGARWAGGLASIFRLNEQHGLRLSFDAGQRVPTVEERYIDFDHSEVGYLLQGNPDLTAEEAFTGRLGWVAQSDDERFGGEVSAYATLLRNRIDPVVIDTAPFTYSYINRGRGLSFGIDAVLRGHDIGGWFGFDISYNFLPIAHDPDTKKDLSLRSHHNARINVRGAWLDKRLVAWTSGGVRSRLLWGGPRPGEIEGMSPKPPGHPIFTWDAGISGNPHEDIWVGLTARNMTNYSDKLWGPMPGFELLLTVEASFRGPSR